MRMTDRDRHGGGRRLRGVGATVAAIAVALAAGGWVSASPAPLARTTSTAATNLDRDRGSGHWVAAWQASPHGGVAIDPPGFNCPGATGLRNQTVRNLVFVSAGGTAVRARLSNAFGNQPLRVGAASVAISAGAAGTVPGTLRALHFGGKPSVLIAAGGEALSDPVHLRVRPLQTVAISVYIPQATGPATEHFLAKQDSYVGVGNRAPSEDAAMFDSTPITCWMFVDGLDVRAPRQVQGAVVALGDSITDGEHSTPNTNQRYPDQLARRLNARRGPSLSVVNAGIAGNTMVRTRLVGGLTMPTAAARLDRDVLSQTGVTDVIVLEGINDIGDGATADEIIDAHQQIIAEAQALGIKTYGATLTPFGGSTPFGGQYGTPEGETQRQAVNRWIRTGSAYDGIFDFDQALRDPQDPTRLLPLYDSGDHLHPNDAGLAALADAVDINALLR
jgi:lysophospholipase L1-like esterase